MKCHAHSITNYYNWVSYTSLYRPMHESDYGCERRKKQEQLHFRVTKGNNHFPSCKHREV